MRQRDFCPVPTASAIDQTDLIALFQAKYLDTMLALAFGQFGNGFYIGSIKQLHNYLSGYRIIFPPAREYVYI